LSSCSRTVYTSKDPKDLDAVVFCLAPLSSCVQTHCQATFNQWFLCRFLDRDYLVSDELNPKHNHPTFTGRSMFAYCLPKSAGYAMIHTMKEGELFLHHSVCLPVMVPLQQGWLQGKMCNRAFLCFKSSHKQALQSWSQRILCHMFTCMTSLALHDPALVCASHLAVLLAVHFMLAYLEHTSVPHLSRSNSMIIDWQAT